MSKTIGILGGLSPESTVSYYQSIIRQHFKFYGNHYYPRIVVISVCYQKYTDLRLNNQWDVIAQNLESEFIRLGEAGADFALVACNTMHKALPIVKSPIPILNIIDVATLESKSMDIKTLVLTGTRFTMTDGFLSKKLQGNNIKVLVPNIKEQDEIERIIRTELTLGKVSSESARIFAEIVQTAIKEDEKQLSDNSYGVLLACTELGMLIPYLPSELKFLDTANLHATWAWKIATGQMDFPENLTV